MLLYIKNPYNTECDISNMFIKFAMKIDYQIYS